MCLELGEKVMPIDSCLLLMTVVCCVSALRIVPLIFICAAVRSSLLNLPSLFFYLCPGHNNYLIVRLFCSFFVAPNQPNQQWKEKKGHWFQWQKSAGHAVPINSKYGATGRESAMKGSFMYLYIYVEAKNHSSQLRFSHHHIQMRTNTQFSRTDRLIWLPLTATAYLSAFKNVWNEMNSSKNQIESYRRHHNADKEIIIINEWHTKEI